MCQGLSVRASEALALGMIDEGKGVVGAVGVVVIVVSAALSFQGVLLCMRASV